MTMIYQLALILRAYTYINKLITYIIRIPSGGFRRRRFLSSLYSYLLPFCSVKSSAVAPLQNTFSPFPLIFLHLLLIFLARPSIPILRDVAMLRLSVLNQ